MTSPVWSLPSTLLETVRELKCYGVDVFFEEQNIHTLSADGELMLSILASYAQEESLSASENQKWRIRKNFEEGKPWNGTMLGYGPKVWHSTDKYRRVIWQCNGKFKGEHRCSTPHLYEEDIKRLFLQAVANLTEAREVLMETCQMLLDEYLNTEKIDAECAALETELEIVSELTRKLIAENATTVIQQDEYNRRYDALAQRYRDAEDRAQQLQSQKVTRRFQADVIESFMNEIRAFDDSLPVQYSDRLWLNLIDRVAVYEDGRLVFRFKNGTEITEIL